MMPPAYLIASALALASEPGRPGRPYGAPVPKGVTRAERDRRKAKKKAAKASKRRNRP